MKAHVFQHVPFEGLGSIGAWLEMQRAQVSYTRFFADDPLPPVDDVDMLIAMGGSMGVNDVATIPWISAEKEFVREAIERDIPVLGVCLGAQVIASALGARVYRNSVQEIGWFPIQAVATQGPVFQFPSECMVFHWHGETFDLPEGAMRLAKSHGCGNQAFQLKHNVIGLQFHLETTPDGALAILQNCRNELVPGPYVQTEQELRAVPFSRYHLINGLMDNVLSYLVRSRADTTIHGSP